MHAALVAAILIMTRPVASAPGPSMNNKSAFLEGINAALRAEGARAIALLNDVDPEALPDKDRKDRNRILARLTEPFAPDTSALTGMPRLLLAGFQSYWYRHLVQALAPSENERQLLREVNALLASQGHGAVGSLDEAEPELKAVLASHGLYALLGVTRPLRELMLWSAQDEKSYAVTLPEGDEDVVVVFLSGFLSHGWAGYATCNRHHTGGWATAGRLYAVSHAYDPGSEKFRISYLVHEGQHFSDYRRFPAMTDPTTLEFRAKLAELATATGTLYTLIDAFSANTSCDPNQPHALANGLVTRRLAAALEIGEASPEAWRRVGPQRVNEAARQLLKADSKGRAASPTHAIDSAPRPASMHGSS